MSDLRGWRYVAVYWEEEDAQGAERISLDVLVDEVDPVFTGLLDAARQKLYRVRERELIGFVIPGAHNF